MNTLALNTLTMRIALAAVGTEGEFTVGFQGRGHQGAERLIPFANDLISKAGMTPETIDSIYTFEGPGSFTGLRLGYAVGKALQMTTKAEFRAVPPLDCIASLYPTWEHPIISVIDARRNKFYARIFYPNKEKTEIFDAQVETLLSHLDSESPFLVAGFGVKAFHEALTPKDTKRAICIEVSAEQLATAMIPFAQNNDLPILDVSAGPIYIRKSDAEENQ